MTYGGGADRMRSVHSSAGLLEEPCWRVLEDPIASRLYTRCRLYTVLTYLIYIILNRTERVHTGHDDQGQYTAVVEVIGPVKALLL